MVENLRRFLATPAPDGFMGVLTVVGFTTLVILFMIFTAMIIVIIYALIKQRRARKLAAEIKVDPKAAYQQILKQEKIIEEFDKESEAEQVKRRGLLVKQLTELQEDFSKNFPWADGNARSALRGQLEQESSANR